MELQYVKQQDYDKQIKTDEYSCLNYYSKKAMKNKYPKGGYTVCGGVGKGLKEKMGRFVYSKQEIKTYYQLKYAKWRYGIDGYIEVGDKQYLAVVKDKLLRRQLQVLSALVLAVIVAFAILNLMNNKINLDSSAKDYKPSNMELANTDPDHIALPGYDQILVNAGENKSYVALWNPPKNPCYFQFTISLKDSSKKIYQSDLIEPGKAITEIKWNQKFKKGTYDIEIDIKCYSLEDGKTEMNGGVITSKLIAIEKG